MKPRGGGWPGGLVTSIPPSLEIIRKNRRGRENLDDQKVFVAN
jgi:hypothetical protein